jgi:hypothetical protein
MYWYGSMGCAGSFGPGQYVIYRNLAACINRKNSNPPYAPTWDPVECEDDPVQSDAYTPITVPVNHRCPTKALRKFKGVANGFIIVHMGDGSVKYLQPQFTTGEVTEC